MIAWDECSHFYAPQSKTCGRQSPKITINRTNSNDSSHCMALYRVTENKWIQMWLWDSPTIRIAINLTIFNLSTPKNNIGLFVQFLHTLRTMQTLILLCRTVNDRRTKMEGAKCRRKKIHFCPFERNSFHQIGPPVSDTKVIWCASNWIWYLAFEFYWITHRRNTRFLFVWPNRIFTYIACNLIGFFICSPFLVLASELWRKNARNFQLEFLLIKKNINFPKNDTRI